MSQKYPCLWMLFQAKIGKYRLCFRSIGSKLGVILIKVKQFFTVSIFHCSGMKKALHRGNKMNRARLKKPRNKRKHHGSEINDSR